MTIENKTIGIIGCGNMGSALVENLKNKLRVKEIFVFDVDKTKQEKLVKSFSVFGSPNLSVLIVQSDILVIAVKPQDIIEVLKEIKATSSKIIITMAAGVSLVFMESMLGKNSAIVRAMPNLNALIAKSVTALCANKAAGQQGLKAAQEIFATVGAVVFVKDDQMNAVTAISGSGPAFVAYLMNSLGRDSLERVMVQEGARFKIDLKTAQVLARETVEGTVVHLKTNFDPDMLIKRVSSKGGTTEAGMKVLEEKGKSEEALREAIRAAEKRAAELSRRG